MKKNSNNIFQLNENNQTKEKVKNQKKANLYLKV